MTPDQKRSDWLRATLGWVVLPVILIMQFVDLRRGLASPGKSLLSVDVVLYSLVILICLPWTIRTLRTAASVVWWIVVPFVALIGYAAVSALIVGPREVYFVSYGAGLPVVLALLPGRAHLVMPAIMAGLALGAAASLVAVMPARLRLKQLWVASALLVVTSYASWPRRIDDLRSLRLSAGMAGAAVVFAALLLTLAVFLASYRLGLWRVASLIGAGASALGVLLTGSRAGLICLALFIVIVFARLIGKRQLPRLVVWGAAGVGTVLATLILLVPEAQRLLSFNDELRELNARIAWQAWTESWHSLVVGQGFGRVWPWYLYESVDLPFPERIVTTAWGEALPHAHSTVLMATVELGLVGAVLLGLVGFAIIRTLAVTREWGRPAFLVAAAFIACLPGWLFDTYLLKNFTLAFWWWFVAFAVYGFKALGQAHDQPGGGPLPDAGQESSTRRNGQASAASAAS